jgi:prephenate dehydratase
VGERVAAGEVEYGMLPIEKSLAGSVIATYDVLASTELAVVGEIVCPIHHCVLALPGVAPDELRRVRSHPVALAQCRRWLAAHPGVEAVSWYDTAGAAQAVAAGGDRATGTIAGRLAAERYGPEVLESEVENRADNQTRFLVVARPDAPLPARAAGGASEMKTSLLAETPNVPGALLHLLSPFAERGVNLSKLESRPAGEPWSYRFFIELDGAADASPVREALAAARENTAVHVLQLPALNRVMEPRCRRPCQGAEAAVHETLDSRQFSSHSLGTDNGSPRTRRPTASRYLSAVRSADFLRFPLPSRSAEPGVPAWIMARQNGRCIATITSTCWMRWPRGAWCRSSVPALDCATATRETRSSPVRSSPAAGSWRIT